MQMTFIAKTQGLANGKRRTNETPLFFPDKMILVEVRGISMGCVGLFYTVNFITQPRIRYTKQGGRQ